MIQVRIVAKATLLLFAVRYPDAEQAIRAWHDEATRAEWSTPHELKQQFVSASILGDKRVVFNIKGNSYRLIVDIEYRMKTIFIVWLGSHVEYDKINARTIRYTKAH
jgi:mRNA interferase HigB